MYRALTQFGMNLAVAEGDIWRRHRKIVAGSFTEVRFDLIASFRVLIELVG